MLLADVRHALRSIIGTPVFTTVAVLSLAVGIGANTAIFSVVNTLLLRPLPVDRPGSLAMVYTSDFSGPPFGASSFPDYLEFRGQTGALEDLAAFGLLPAAVVAGRSTERAIGFHVTGNYFELLGVRARMGRIFSRDDDAAWESPVVVLSERFWQRLGRSPDILNQSIVINEQPFVVIGVAAADFTGLQLFSQPDFWIPAATLPQVRAGSDSLTSRGSRNWLLVGRLANGTGIEQAQAAFQVLAAQLAQAYPDAWLDVRRAPRRITLAPATVLPPDVRGAVVSFMTLLMAVVGLVLLIACANVANLLLTRAAARRREIAIRLSIGASRARLVRLLLTESLVLSIMSGMSGLLLAFWMVRAISAFRPPSPVPISIEPTLDLPVLLFALALSVATGLIFGLVPALQSTRSDVVTALKGDEALSLSGRRLTPGHALVVGQVALSVLVLVAAGLLIRTLQASRTVNLGFEPERVAVASVDLTGTALAGPERSTQTFSAIIERLRQLPEVEQASVAAFTPLGLASSRRSARVEGYQPRPGEDMERHYNVVSPDYFDTMQIRIVKGRRFTEQDRTGAPLVAIVNETFARRFWPDTDPIGKRISVGGPTAAWIEIVGITEDGHYVSLLDETLPYFFLPLAQHPEATGVVHVRSRGGDTANLLVLTRSAIREIDSTLPVFDTALLGDAISVGLLPHRMAATWLGAFGTIALLLAALGLYGVLGHSVSSRRREIGIRMALGADARSVLSIFLRQGMRVVAIGLALGVLAAFGVTRMLTFLLFQVSPTDPATFLGASIVLVLVALAATYLPARRAALIDPIRVLRQE